MLDGGFISSPVIRALLRFLQPLLDTAELCASLQIDPALANDPDHLFPASIYPALLETAIARTGQTDLGLRFGMMAEPDRWGVLGYIMACSRTVADAMTHQQRYQALIGSIGTLTMQLTPTTVKLAWETPTPPIPALAEEAVAGWVTFGRWITHSERSPLRVHFLHPAPPHAAAYHAFFRCDVCFDSDCNGLEIPLDFLALPLRQPDEHMQKWLQRAADEKLQTLPGTPDWLQRLQQFIETELPQRVPTLDSAAAHLQLTPRQLQRRLEERNTHFTAFCEDSRKQLAQRYLQDPSCSIVEITFLLGFSEQSAFSRAFKRWFGISPGEFRRQLRTPPSLQP